MMGSLSRVLQPMSQTRRISVSALPQGQRSRSATLLGRRDRRLLWVVGSGWDLNAALIQECPEDVVVLHLGERPEKAPWQHHADQPAAPYRANVRARCSTRLASSQRACATWSARKQV